MADENAQDRDVAQTGAGADAEAVRRGRPRRRAARPRGRSTEAASELPPPAPASARTRGSANEDADAIEAARDAESALEAVQAEAASELPPPTPTVARPVESRPAEDAGDGSRQNRRKVREGIVVSDGMSATVVVAVVERVRHPKYGKTVQRTKKLYVHDGRTRPRSATASGSQETRPISKLKRWRLTEVVERAR